MMFIDIGLLLKIHKTIYRKDAHNYIHNYILGSHRKLGFSSYISTEIRVPKGFKDTILSDRMGRYLT